MSACGAAALLVVVAGSATAQPINTTLPGGWSWQPLPAMNGTYDTGTIATAVGGANGQTSGPYSDTSFGVMDEPNTPWFSGADQTSQQYVQAQAFGNFGTSSPPGPAGFRYFNFGYGSTAAGSNFPSVAGEVRSLSMNNWNNPNPDAGGVATAGQIVYIPVSATFSTTLGLGADEMVFQPIGGTGGATSTFRLFGNIVGGWNTTAFGGLSNSNNRVEARGNTTVFDPGALGNYVAFWGLNSGLTPGQTSLNMGGNIIDEGNAAGNATAGLTANSIGHAFTDMYNVLSSLPQDGSSFTVTFDGQASVALIRDFGNADARISMGPGMQGFGRLVVQWQAFQAVVPTPGAAALLGMGALVAGRRRR
jgi:hypothetical protein